MKRFVISIWSICDSLYLSCSRLQCLEKFSGKTNILRIRLTRYKGRAVTLSDGTIINKNDLLVKIHLHNVRLLKEMQQIDERFKKSLYLYKSVEKSLPGLANFIQQHTLADHIKGIVGITMLDRAYKPLGFEAAPITSVVYFWFKRIGQYPIHLLSNSAKKKQKSLTPRYLFMSKHVLNEKYGETLPAQIL